MLVCQILEQVAKEVGDVYTNRQKLEHMGPEVALSALTHASSSAAETQQDLPLCRALERACD